MADTVTRLPGELASVRDAAWVAALYWQEAGSDADRDVARERSPSPCRPSSHLREELNRAWRAVQELALEQAISITSRLQFVCNEIQDSSSDAVRGELQVLRAAALALADDSAAAPAAARAMQSPLSPALYELAQTICRFGCWNCGDQEGFDKISREKLAKAGASRQFVAGAFDLCLDAAIQMQHLRLGMAKWMAADALRFAEEVAGQGSTPALIALTLMAQIAYEQGDPDRIGSHLQELMQNPLAQIPVESLVRAYPLLAHLHAGRGDYSRAVQQLMEGEELGEDRGSARLMSVCLRERIYWLLADGQSAEAQECLTRLSRLDRLQRVEACGRRSLINADHALAGAWFAVTCERSDHGMDVMRQLRREAVLHGDRYAAVRLGVCLVDALLTLGHQAEASALLLELLCTGMAAGLCQSFIDGGAGVQKLILNMYQNGYDGDEELRPFLGVMVSRLKQCGQVAWRPAELAHPQEKILTPRETHVLRLIGGGLSNKRIARDLNIAPETVKSHAKHIFAKLGTRTRAESITRAVKLSLL